MFHWVKTNLKSTQWFVESYFFNKKSSFEKNIEKRSQTEHGESICSANRVSLRFRFTPTLPALTRWGVMGLIVVIGCGGEAPTTFRSPTLGGRNGFCCAVCVFIVASFYLFSHENIFFSFWVSEKGRGRFRCLSLKCENGRVFLLPVYSMFII